ncbi:hypothetical protein BBO99_00008627 [Phytophthora kernoviae]|uniref:Uncharacterized protein n=2 Tax=Phytophthora kernoviae TaxID=325452 RepID=A0A3R7KFI7_9STRA|nr:hypothetical protein G195_011066 [Phytophthora kernoviae 00238/432]KAG2505183.1 hypothetical protein JM18_009501 [Phytophthora kernoviae]KAG2507301.1 hypothetical protein JM16_008433 [Phytophthora kernoviae]RLN14386.1 hypothetical protein BBI17_008655 [Phytophthora kernoviae]RLN74964.1 hypothetical protein BBO99_00008627 [Phytophthora kernoviae]
MAETVRNLLGNVTNVVKIEEALRTPSPAGAGFEGFVPNLNDAIYIDLASNLGKLYMDASTVLAPQDMTEMEEVPNTLEIRRDASGMPYVEFRTTIYAGLELREAAKTIWSVKGCHYNKYRKYMTDLGMKKETEMELRDQSMAMAVSTMSLARSYEEDDRSLVTFNSLSASVIQASYRLSPDAESLPFPYGSTSNIDATNVFVLQNLGAVMQANMRSIRATFLDAQPQPNPGRIPATC